MTIYSYASFGYEGELVSVEVDLRPALPGFEIVGLPDSAIREAKERIRVAIRNSGFEYPTKRILVNLYPAGLPKSGAAFDLPIALGILARSGQLRRPPERIFALGELQLSGRVRAVDGVIAALHESLRLGQLARLVPGENRNEAAALGIQGSRPVETLYAAADPESKGPLPTPASIPQTVTNDEEEPDYGDMAGCGKLLRIMQIAALGRHHLLLCGPPGSGKTMAARRLPSLLPPLEGTEALETSRIHSLAGKLDRSRGLLRRPPFRTPHHSASREGLIGGGAGLLQPGEVSLAHHGLLLLDEAAEFNANVLQALREPLEQNRVELARAGRRAFFPANFMLVLTLNPCPCGNLGREEGICLCSPREIHRYWRGLGGALLDRIVIRVAMEPLSPEALIRGERSSSADLREELSIGREFRRSRKGRSELSPRGEEMLIGLVRDRGYSNRAVEGVRAVARTIADLKGSFPVGEEEIFEAGELRSFGENLYYSGERIPAGR